MIKSQKYKYVLKQSPLFKQFCKKFTSNLFDLDICVLLIWHSIIVIYCLSYHFRALLYIDVNIFVFLGKEYTGNIKLLDVNEIDRAKIKKDGLVTDNLYQ